MGLVALAEVTSQVSGMSGMPPQVWAHNWQCSASSALPGYSSRRLQPGLTRKAPPQASPADPGAPLASSCLEDQNAFLGVPWHTVISIAGMVYVVHLLPGSVI